MTWHLNTARTKAANSILLSKSRETAGFGRPHTVNSNANVSFLQGRGVIDTVTSHANHVMSLLQHLHNHELVLREHLSKAISLLDQVFSILEALWHTLAFLGLCVVAQMS